MFRVNNEASNPLTSHERSLDALRTLETRKCHVLGGHEVCVCMRVLHFLNTTHVLYPKFLLL